MRIISCYKSVVTILLSDSFYKAKEMRDTDAKKPFFLNSKYINF